MNDQRCHLHEKSIKRETTKWRKSMNEITDYLNKMDDNDNLNYNLLIFDGKK